MIRRFTIVLSFIVISLVAKSQQDPYYTHFMLNKLAFNPGTAGYKDAICANVLAHRQWTGLNNKYEQEFNPATVGRQPIGPTTYFASVTAPVKKLHGGAGFLLMSDAIGYERTINVKASYAFHYLLSNGSIIQIGLDAGMIQKEFDGSFYNPRQPGDPLIPDNVTSGRKFDLGLGAYYNNPALYNLEVGLSATHITGGQVTYQAAGATQKVDIVPNMYLVASTAHPIGAGNIILQPNVLVKRISATTQFDLNCRAAINEIYVAGLSYRDGGRSKYLDALALQLGYYVKPNFYLGYSYDIPITRGLAGGGTHEIFASYCFNLTIDPPPLRYRVDPRFLGGYK